MLEAMKWRRPHPGTSPARRQQRHRCGSSGKFSWLLPRSQRHDPAVVILVPGTQEVTMRAYLKAAGMAFGLMVVWTALVQFVA
jgi:hypothetical protein